VVLPPFGHGCWVQPLRVQLSCWHWRLTQAPVWALPPKPPTLMPPPPVTPAVPAGAPPVLVAVGTLTAQPGDM
jgi:hypothetical protein